MRLLILTSRLYDFSSDCYQIGGVETYLRNLASVARGCGFEVHAFFYSVEDRIAVLSDGLIAHGVYVDGTRSTSKLEEKAREVGNIDEDILLFGTSIVACKTAFKKVIAIQHGIYWDCETIHGMGIASRAASTAARAFQAKQILDQHSCVSRMVCVDLNYVNWMRALSVHNRLPYTYIPNFADTSQAVPDRRDDGKVRIVFARRFEEIRGCGLLIDVMPRILREHPEVELTVAGGGSLEANLHDAFDGDDRVTFTRYDAGESIAFHGQFDIALVPSVASEGTSLSLLEAMAAGCAVVATDVGGMANIVLSGHNGLLVRPEADDLHRAVDTLVEETSLRSRLAHIARQTVEDSFSRERWAESWKDLLRGLAIS